MAKREVTTGTTPVAVADAAITPDEKAALDAVEVITPIFKDMAADQGFGDAPGYHLHWMNERELDDNYRQTHSIPVSQQSPAIVRKAAGLEPNMTVRKRGDLIAGYTTQANYEVWVARSLAEADRREQHTARTGVTGHVTIRRGSKVERFDASGGQEVPELENTTS